MDKRTQLLVAAEDLFAKNGLSGFSMKQLADNAGIAAGTIYIYFKNKDDLIQQLHLDIMKFFAKTLFNNFSEQNDPYKQYEIFWRNTFNGILKNPVKLYVNEMLCFVTHEKPQNINLLQHDFFIPFMDFYSDGIKRGTFIDAPIPVLISLSFDTSINFAKKVIYERVEPTEEWINLVIKSSWSTILRQI